MDMSRRGFLGASSAAVIAAGTMAQGKVQGIVKSDWALNHVGLVVRDWNQALGYYQSIDVGISVGPQPVYLDLEGGPRISTFYNRNVDRISGGSGPKNTVDSKPKTPGKAEPSTYRFADKDCQVGSLQLEILRDGGIPVEGITHLCFNVADIKAETDKLVEKGCKIILSFDQGDRIIENYIDTRKFGHLILSLRGPVDRIEKAWKAHNEKHPLVSDWKFRGVGIAVEDIDRAVEYYQSLDLGVFESEVMVDSGSFEKFEVYGEAPGTVAKARFRTAQIGPVAYDFVQPLEGEVLYKESLDSRGEGISDIAFTVDDLDKETARLTKKGVSVILSAKPRTGSAFAYFDTREFSGNIMLRLMQAE